MNKHDVTLASDDQQLSSQRHSPPVTGLLHNRPCDSPQKLQTRTMSLVRRKAISKSVIFSTTKVQIEMQEESRNCSLSTLGERQRSTLNTCITLQPCGWAATSPGPACAIESKTEPKAKDISAMTADKLRGLRQCNVWPQCYLAQDVTGPHAKRARLFSRLSLHTFIAFHFLWCIGCGQCAFLFFQERLAPNRSATVAQICEACMLSGPEAIQERKKTNKKRS